MIGQIRRRAMVALASILTVAATATVTTAAAQAGDPAVYSALPAVSEVQVSPDGKTVAVLQHAGAASGLMFYEIDNPGAKPTGVGLGDADARGIVWANDDNILLLASQSEQVATSAGIQTIEFFRWLTVSKSKAKASILLGNEAGYFVGSAGQLLALMPHDPKHAVFARYSTSGSGRTTESPSRLRSGSEKFTYSLFLVDVENGSQRRLETGNESTEDWVVTAAGDAIMRIDFDPRTKERKIFTRPTGKGQFNLVKTIDERDADGVSTSYYGPGATANTVYASEYVGDHRALFEVDLNTGDMGAIVFTDASYDFDRVVYDERKATATGVRYTDDVTRTFHLDAADRTMQENLRKAIPGSAPQIVSKSADGNRLVVEVSYTDHPKQFYLFDKAARSLNMIAASYPPLDGKVAAKKEKYDYVSSDGLTIHGYLTVPAGSDKKNAPLIVLPHGGPESRSDQEFDWWSFFYASRGYLVYEPNFRGSDGYGYAFRSAGYGEWGRKMQADVTDGVNKLIADGIADPSRICIVGASYGGYAALAGATLTPDLYACAVSVNGVSNLPGMIGQSARDSEMAEDYWSTRIGNRFRDADELAAVSPSSIADRAGAPILLLVSKDDIVVPPSQSIQMRDALKRAGKPHEYVELKGEDHWLSTAAARTEVLARSIDFIDRHIGQR